MIIPSRRSFLTGLGASLVAAPAIVRAASLMPVRAIVMPVLVFHRPAIATVHNPNSSGLAQLFLVNGHVYVAPGETVSFPVRDQTQGDWLLSLDDHRYPLKISIEPEINASLTAPPVPARA